MPRAVEKISVVVPPVAAAIKERIEAGEPVSENDIELLSSVISARTQKSVESGFGITADAQVSGSPTSSSSVVPSNGSKPQWQLPTSAREVAKQANRVATMVLNGEIGLEEAKTYSATLRTAAQMLGMEVQRSRYLGVEPDLRLNDEG